nr:CDP-glycerol glycerophosphotransferase family protein [Sinobaca sp. H24]
MSPNRYSTDIFRRAFSYDKNLLETGYPRNDYLVHHKEEDVQRVKRRLGIPADKK